LNANLKLQGQPCLSCQTELALGDAAAQCQACDGVHHAKCWDAAGGCASAGCANAPLKRLDDVVPAPATRLGFKKCGACNSEIMESDSICPYCNSITSPDGIYHGPTENAPGAVSSLVFGIVGLLVCGLIFGIVAISKSKTARQHIASDPRYTGGGLATAGLVLGIIDLVAWALIVLVQLGGQ
jgi:hypothetical protein